MTRTELDRDARRFQAWQLDAMQARLAGAEPLAAGPFQVFISATDAPASRVTLVDGTATQAEVVKGASKLRSTFKKNKGALEIEYNEGAFPDVGPWLEAAGFKLHERNPLMSCRPEAFKPVAASGVMLTRLTSTSNPDELKAFQDMRWRDGGDKNRTPPPLEHLLDELASANNVFLLAWLNWEPAGTGASHSLNGAAEIVGVVTRADLRRRGVAATVTSDLVARHFASGADFAFLDAASQEAARVYERLGFTRFGAHVVYR